MVEFYNIQKNVSGGLFILHVIALFFEAVSLLQRTTIMLPEKSAEKSVVISKQHLSSVFSPSTTFLAKRRVVKYSVVVRMNDAVPEIIVVIANELAIRKTASRMTGTIRR